MSNRTYWLPAVATILVALAGCDKPSEGDCQKAIANIRTLLGTDTLTATSGETAAWVRSCQGSAKKSTVTCAMEASTIEQLRRCGLLKGVDLGETGATPTAPAPTPTAPPPGGTQTAPAPPPTTPAPSAPPAPAPAPAP